MKKAAAIIFMCLATLFWPGISHAQTQINPNQINLTQPFNTFNNVLYVGGGITNCAGSDIGAQINSCYAALPATGGEIDILQNPNGTAYSFSTPITFTTSGKYILLRCISTSGGDVSSQGCTLNYTPTNATTALRMDYSSNGNGPFNANHGLEGITITNNGCITSGGCGSRATGIDFGAANAGAQSARISSVKVQGFGTGINYNNGTGWGIVFINLTLSRNTTGMSIPNALENVAVLGGRFVQNGTAWSQSNQTIDSYVKGVSWDGNTTIAYAGQGLLTCEGCHFENNGGATANYISTSGQVALFGGEILDDNTTALAQHVTCTGGGFAAYGTSLSKAGGTVTNSVVVANQPCKVDLHFINTSPTIYTAGKILTGSTIGISNTSMDTQNPFNFGSASATAGDIATFNPNTGVAGPWGITLKSAGAGGATLGPYFRFNDVVWEGDNVGGNLYAESGPGGTVWMQITSAGTKILTSAGLLNVPQVIASGTATMTTAAVTAGKCGTIVTVAASGVATTDTITWAFNAAPAGSNAGLVAWPTANNVNFAYCPNSPETPAAATINWRVVR